MLCHLVYNRSCLNYNTILEISEDDRDYYLERRYPSFGNLVPRDVASRAAKERCDAGFGVNKTGEAVYLDFSSAIIRYGKEKAPVSYTHPPSPRDATLSRMPSSA